MRGRKCEAGCTCGRHSSETRRRISEAAKVRTYTDERRLKVSESVKRAYAAHTPGFRAESSVRRSEAAKAAWAREKAEGRRRRLSARQISRHELVLVPYMEQLGYRHNRTRRIGSRVPDFVSDETQQVYEYFGTYWHKPGDDQRAVQHYIERGWGCAVLWESDLFTFLTEHQYLVTFEQHAEAWKAAHVNYGYRKPVSAL